MAIGTNDPTITLQHEAKGTSEAVAANERLADSVGSAGMSMMETVASGALMVNQLLEIGDKALGAAKAMIDYSRAGAQANDIQAAADNAALAMGRFTDATMASIDGTTLQTIALRTMSEEGIGLTGEQFENLGRLAAASSARTGKTVAEILESLSKGSAEAAQEIGILIDTSAEKFLGLSEAQKKQAIVQQLAAEGAKVTAEELDSQWLRVQKSEAAWGNLESTMQQFVATQLDKSGAIDAISAAMDNANKFYAENQEAIDSIISSAISLVKHALKPAIAAFGALVKVAEALLEPLAFVLETVDELKGSYLAFLNPAAALYDAFVDGGSAAEDFTEKISKLAEEQRELAKASRAAAKGMIELRGVLISPESVADATEAIQDWTWQFGAFRSGVDLARQAYVSFDKSIATERLAEYKQQISESAKEAFELSNAVLNSAYSTTRQREAAEAAADRLLYYEAVLYTIADAERELGKMYASTTEKIVEQADTATQKDAERLAKMEEFFARLEFRWEMFGFRAVQAYDRIDDRLDSFIDKEEEWASMREALAERTAAFQEKKADERLKWIDDTRKAEMAFGSAVVGASQQVALAMGQGTGWRSHLEAGFKFAEGVYYAAIGMVPQAVGAFSSAALHEINAAEAGVSGGGGGTGAASGAATAAAREPMAAFGGFQPVEEGPRETLYLVVDGRVFGEVSIDSINRTERNGSNRQIRSSIIGGTQRTFS